MTGRPSTYSQEIADEVCRRLAGGESLRAICRDEGIPANQPFVCGLWTIAKASRAICARP